jgi:hypothetical protein
MFINIFQYSKTLRSLLLNQNSALTDKNLFENLQNENQDLLNSSIYSNSTQFDFTQLLKLLQNSEVAEETNSELTDTFNNFLGEDIVNGIIDTDNNGDLSNEEISEFLKVIESLDGNPEEMSYDDILSAIQNANTGAALPNETALPDETVETEDSEINTSTKNYSTGSSSYSYDSGSSNTQTSDSNNINNLSLEELESKKSAQETEVQSAQDKVRAVYAGETDAIKAAQADCDEKRIAYEEALKNDENISDELRERESQNQSDIDNENKIINDVKADISDKENEITKQENTISSDESNISALESAIASLSSQTSDDDSVKADIVQKLSNAKSQLEEAKEKLASDKETLEKLNSEKAELENNLSEEEEKLSELETEKQSIQAEILANCNETTKLALEAFNTAEDNIEQVRANELSAAKTSLEEAEAKLNEINEVIKTKEAQKVKSTYSVNDLGNIEQLYENMGLEEKGLNFEVFSRALEGYNNLEDKGNGYLGIFDTTQDASKERYYLLDLNNFELVGQTAVKTGSGNMDNVVSANKPGSHATLSGFEKVGSEYYSSSMGKRALRLYGLEDGINDNSYEKGTVVHYTVNNSTWGCKGFTPVRTNGKIDKEATYEKMRKLFPENAIIFTYPTDSNYWNLSELYA